MKTTSILLAAAAVVLLQGCATKNYGRQGDLTTFEQTNMSCREIDLEEARVEGFLKHIETESGFDGRSVLSFMGDFGIGNVMEKNSATESATRRLQALTTARASKGCPARR